MSYLTVDWQRMHYHDINLDIYKNINTYKRMYITLFFWRETHEKTADMVVSNRKHWIIQHF